MKEDETIEQKKNVDKLDGKELANETIKKLKKIREEAPEEWKNPEEEKEFQGVVTLLELMGLQSEYLEDSENLIRVKKSYLEEILKFANAQNENTNDFCSLLDKALIEENIKENTEKFLKLHIKNFNPSEEQTNIIEKFNNISCEIFETWAILEVFELIDTKYNKEKTEIVEEQRALLEKAIKLKRNIENFNIDVDDYYNRLHSTLIQKTPIAKLLNQTESITQIKNFISHLKFIEDDYSFIFVTPQFLFSFHQNESGLEIKCEIEEESNEKKIETFNPKPVEKAISFNDKISNSFSNLINNEITEITKTGTKNKKNNKLKEEVVNVFISNGMMETSRPLEEFDRQILECVYSITKKNKCFDIQMIKDFWGNNRHKTKLDEDIEKSLTKLRTTLISIEIPEVIMKTYEKDFEKVGIKDNILPVKEIYQIKGGHKKSVFAFTSKPLYFEYVEARGQMITKDIKLLQGGVGKLSKESVTLSGYIYRRIENAKYQKQRSQENKEIAYNKEALEHIRFDTLFDLIFTDEDKKLSPKSLQKKKSRTKNDIIFKIFEHHKRNKNIKKYKEYSEGIKFEI